MSDCNEKIKLTIMYNVRWLEDDGCADAGEAHQDHRQQDGQRQDPVQPQVDPRENVAAGKSAGEGGPVPLPGEPAGQFGRQNELCGQVQVIRLCISQPNIKQIF